MAVLILLLIAAALVLFVLAAYLLPHHPRLIALGLACLALAALLGQLGSGVHT